MAKPFRFSFVLLAGAAALLSPSLTAQMRGGGFGGGSLGGSSGGGGRLGGNPMTPPPMHQPALGGQPLFGNDASAQPPAGGCMPAAPGPAPDPLTMGKKAAGKDLKAAVKKVTALHWNNSLDAARAEALATGKPVLWLQALGDIDGFA